MDEALYTAYLKGSLRLSQHGEWFHNGKPFTNANVIALFNRSIVWDAAAAQHYVRIGLGRAEFDLEDTAWFVSELLDAQLPWQVRLLDGSIEELDPAALSCGSAGQIYCRVKNGQRARFMRNAHQALIRHAVDEKHIQMGAQLVELQPLSKTAPR